MKNFSLILLEDNETIMNILNQVTIMDLAIALKFAEQDVKDFLYENIPNHQKEVLEELIPDIDQITKEDSYKAQQTILDLLAK